MAPDHDFRLHRDGHPKPPPQGENAVLSPSTGRIGDGAGQRILVVAPQPFYGDRGTPIALRKVLEALSQLAYQVDVLTFPVGCSPEIPGVRYFRVANPLRIRAVPIGCWDRVYGEEVPLLGWKEIRQLQYEGDKRRYQALNVVPAGDRRSLASRSGMPKSLSYSDCFG